MTAPTGRPRKKIKKKRYRLSAEQHDKLARRQLFLGHAGNGHRVLKKPIGHETAYDGEYHYEES